ncbi:HAD family hydrolase [Streptomyces sp. NPDC048258]|uniref:HAD family hydrolase n=1 Tax=Streptomyces sp. NPDC048258 TaxID=3365527 RepID=UPI0037115C9E
MKRRMIVCDLDGTLLNTAGEVSQRTRMAIRRVQDAGHVVVIATARPVRDTRAVAAAIGGRSLAVCGNGAVVYDFWRDALVQYHPLDCTRAAAAMTALRERFPLVRLGAEQGFDLVLEDGFELPAVLGHQAHRLPRLEDSLTAEGFGKLLVQLDGAAGRYCEAVREALPDCEVTISASLFCEVMARGVTKANALRLVARTVGLHSRDVIAFGDMPNDLPMLRWAGHAVAVANAHPDVLASVGEVTGSNDDDGVAKWLEQMDEPG